MKTINIRTAAMVAAGVLGLGGLAVAAPALAGAGPFGSPGSVAEKGDGAGFYGMGAGHSTGRCTGLAVTAEQGTLTEAQKATLASMAQEEKLAHDLYVAFAARYDVVVFDHIALAETRHLSTVRTLLQRYGVADPTATRSAGTFTDPAVQGTYDELLAQGEQSLAAALAAGQQVERDDIAALNAALNGLTAPDAKQVYGNLLAASERHLAVFTRWASR